MKINSVDIKGVGGIKKIHLEFNDHLNVICGTNGVGKTTILEAIITGFSSSSIRLKRNVKCNCADVNINFTNSDGVKRDSKYSVVQFTPNNEISTPPRTVTESEHVFYFRTERQIEYKQLPGVMKDRTSSVNQIARSSIDGIQAEDIKQWFVNRDLYIDKNDSLTETQKQNYYIAVRNFSIMDPTIKFKKVEAASLEILLETSKGDILFEYLSAGYKSCIYILFGIIKEIEFRFKNPSIYIRDFNGIILIDEIDIHLHPHWQAKLIVALKELLPKAQIIATTHSPSILQVLEKHEIIPLEDDVDNGVSIKELNLGDYGLQGWTLEEILTDVMGVPSTSSRLFTDAIKDFDDALAEENVEKINSAYELLDEMLHPNSNLRRILKIQMAGLEE
ncbi:MAG: AAA family ATPase [Anaerocolumna sp.]